MILPQFNFQQPHDTYISDMLVSNFEIYSYIPWGYSMAAILNFGHLDRKQGIWGTVRM